MKTIRDILMYGALWCGDCNRSKRLFEEYHIPFTYKDIDADTTADAELRTLIGEGNRSIPRILFRSGPDTTHMNIDNTLIEPSNNDLLRELRIRMWIKPEIKKRLTI